MHRYLEIASEIEGKIINDSLKSGAKVDSVRRLCELYNCHKSTALKALNLLKEKGFLYSIPQSGFYVTDNEDKLSVNSNLIDFKSSAPDPGLFPYKDYQKCVNISIEKNRSALFKYSDQDGYIPLRKAITKLLTKDYIFTSYKNIVVTTGIQQGLSLFTAMSLKSNKSEIVIEEPSYHRYIEYLKNNQRQVVTVNREHTALDLEALEEIFKSGEVKLFYTMPRVHNPLGTSLSKYEKEKLIELAYKYDVYIIEDDFMGDYIIDKNNDPLISYDIKKSHVIYLRSFSKIIFPGLRIGYAVLPTSLVDKFSRDKYLIDNGSSLLNQASVERYLSNGMFERHVQKMSTLYARRADVLSKSLSKLNHKEKKDDHTSHANTHKSKYIHTCIELSEKCSIKDLEERGIKIADINEYYYQNDKKQKNYLPINVSNMDEKKIEAGLEKLYKHIKV